jgi:hypothetical protein
LDLFHHDNDEEQLLIAFGPAGFSQHHYAHLSASLSYLNMLVSYCPAGAVKQRPPSGKIAPLRSARAPYACAPHSARSRARARRQSCPKSRRWSTRAPPRWPRRPRRRRPRHRRSRRVRNRGPKSMKIAVRVASCPIAREAVVATRRPTFLRGSIRPACGLRWPSLRKARRHVVHATWAKPTVEETPREKHYRRR